MQDQTKRSTETTGCCSRGGCVGRREFLELAIGSASLSLLPSLAAVAGPLSAADFEKLVPADKKLRPAWIASLAARGEPAVYRGADLEKIGMPVGGICAGQLYLGGDGRLWHWDIFNGRVPTGDAHYAHPPAPAAPLEQGFALSVASPGATGSASDLHRSSQVRPLDRTGWREVTFSGEYPIGRVEYRDADCPVSVSLEAFSPFVPLAADDSSLPATIMRFTLTNRGAEPVEAQLAGWLENAVCLESKSLHGGRRRNRIVRLRRLLFLDCSAEPDAEEGHAAARPDIVFEDFEKGTYENWEAIGTAFGDGPIKTSQLAPYQGDVGAQGNGLVNTHNVRRGGQVVHSDEPTGTLTSKPFTIERRFISFLIGGGAHAGRTCINLLVDGHVVATATGANENRMRPGGWGVEAWAGKTARLQIVDNESGPWGNIGIDQIVFTDRPPAGWRPLAEESDFGTLGLALLDPQPSDRARPALPGSPGKDPLGTETPLSPGHRFPPCGVFGGPGKGEPSAAAKPLSQRLVGSLARRLSLAAGESKHVTFVLTWHFPKLRLDEGRGLVGRHYATRFPSALAVAEHVARQFDRYHGLTRLWHDTWYDSTLPYWFLDRTLANASILATSTCHWLANGRFYGWEGVGCCEGTCGHVWHYAHAVARLFPELERDARRRVDFGLAQRPDGAVRFRGEFTDVPAADGQAGCVLRAYREHRMSADNGFLKSVWPQVKKALMYLIREDGNADGLLEGRQHNTLDTDWYGPVAWLSSLYLAALSAGAAMAGEMGDPPFAALCRTILKRGQRNLVARLFDGEYFVNRPDPHRPETINSGSGCHIDQVFGQSWAFQVGLGRVLPEKEARSALAALWRYNFTPDVGPFRRANKPGRWYAMPGEGGLLMCTFPRADWDYQKAKGQGADWAAGYFNECMNGFEYQVAGHMLWEGMVTEGLAVTRMIHDRYHAARRNPWNEVECGDHYARSMASYGVYLAACGFEHHGPKGHLAFAPRLSPENFRAAFTAAEGWGTLRQTRNGAVQTNSIELCHGHLRLASLAFELPEGAAAKEVRVRTGETEVPANHAQSGRRLSVNLPETLVLQAGQRIEIEITS
jgi:uncharacterized protein (DUF608 family)